MIIWFNGELMDEADVRIAPNDRGFLLGDGLFETLLARQGRIAFLDAHVVRLSAGGNILGIPLPASTRHLAIACGMLLEANGLTESPRTALRITLTRGPGPRGLLPPDKPVPTLMISVSESPVPATSQSAILATPRRNALSPVSRLKALPYLDNLLAREEARSRGADEALMLDTSGHLRHHAQRRAGTRRAPEDRSRRRHDRAAAPRPRRRGLSHQQPDGPDASVAHRTARDTDAPADGPVAGGL